MAHFADHAVFSLAGSPAASPVPMSVAGAAPLREAMGQLIADFHFEHVEILAIIVEGDRAAVHLRARVRSAGTGEVAETEIVDVMQFEDGRIISHRQFADTALASRLLGR
jgi:ketosteroid isomerase-like protein